MNLSEFSVKNTVFANLVMIIVIVAGLFALSNLPQEDIPPIDFNWAFIRVAYPGAAPQEVEELVINPIEEKVKNLAKVDKYRSRSAEGFGVIVVEFQDMSDYEFQTTFQDLKNDIDDITFPDGLKDINVEKMSTSAFLPLIELGINYYSDEEIAADIVDDLKDDIARIKGVGNVQVSGLSDKVVQIYLDPSKMDNLNVSLSSIISVINSNNMNLPIGDIDLKNGRYLLKAEGDLTVDKLKDLPILKGKNGGVVRLADVASVEYRRKDKDILSKINGESSISISVSKKADGQTLDISNKIKKLLKKYKKKVPSSVTFTILSDQSDSIRQNIKTLRMNALVGMFVVFVVMYLFLGFWNALLSLVGIPISFLITFYFMKLTGQTINGSSLFALVMVLGIIVDDAIIILENVFSHNLKSETLTHAVISGANEVSAPVITGALTTIAAFLPLMFLPGIFGKFLRVIPIVVSLALLASLFEALFILPSHIVEWVPKGYDMLNSNKIKLKKLIPLYEKILRKILHFRYVAFVFLFVLVAGAVVVVPKLGFDLFSGDPYPTFRVLIKYPENYSLSKTDSITTSIYKRFKKELPKEKIKYFMINSGLYQAKGEWLTQKNVAQIVITLYDKYKYDIDDITKRIRPILYSNRNISSFRFSKQEAGPPKNDPISIQIKGESVDKLKEVSEYIKDKLNGYKGVYDIDDDMPLGKEEITFKINAYNAQKYGLSVQSILTELQTKIYGIKVGDFKDGTDEIEINLKYKEKSFSNIEDLKNLYIHTRTGLRIPVKNVAEISEGKGISKIRHYDGERTLTVGASMNKKKYSLNTITAKIKKEIFPDVKEKFKGVNLEFGGAFRDFMDTFKDLIWLGLIGVLVIYTILATQFNSYLQPAIILFTIPFGFIGAIFGLLIMGFKFSLGAIYGIIALAGIVVNDAIVLISFVNTHRTNNMDRIEAVVEAGKRRLRPILLTSITTIFGLLPTMIGFGGKSLSWQPLSSVIVFGLFLSTFMTLFMIPSLIVILDDIKTLGAKIFRKIFKK